VYYSNVARRLCGLMTGMTAGRCRFFPWFFLRPVIPTANFSSPNSSYRQLFLQRRPILPSRTVLYILL